MDTADGAGGARNLVLCCDGTANQFADDQTSVVKLARAMVKDSERQQVIYHPGIGTRDPVGDGTRIGSLIGRVAGLAFGYDLERDIADAYTFLMNHHRPGDRLFLFGFSRGAYTARAVASLLKMYGLVMPGNEALVPYIVRMLWQGSRLDGDPAKRARFFGYAHAFRETLSATACRPHFLGVWDTVSSVGWIGRPVALPYTHTNPDIRIIRHAVAIDERRAFFRTNLVNPVPGQDVAEVWFPGVHCDVGGGYPEPTSGFSKYALQWMADEAGRAGLLLDRDLLAKVLGETDPSFQPASPHAPRHESLRGLWRLAEFVPKRHWNAAQQRRDWRFNLFRRRRIPPGSAVHRAAWALGNDYLSRLPKDIRPVD